MGFGQIVVWGYLFDKINYETVVGSFFFLGQIGSLKLCSTRLSFCVVCSVVEFWSMRVQVSLVLAGSDAGCSGKIWVVDFNRRSDQVRAASKSFRLAVLCCLYCRGSYWSFFLFFVD